MHIHTKNIMCLQFIQCISRVGDLVIYDIQQSMKFICITSMLIYALHVFINLYKYIYIYTTISLVLLSLCEILIREISYEYTLEVL